MKAINQNATTILNRLTQDLKTIGDNQRFEESAAFMAVCVEYINETDLGPVFSVAHYYEQCGDLMRDPDMTFLRRNGNYYPLSYQHDGLGIYQESVLFGEDGNPEKFFPDLQKEHAVFAGQWLTTIKAQQRL
jgi:hypothetical protein